MDDVGLKTAASSATAKRGKPLFWLVAAVLLFLGSTLVAYLQSPRPNPFQAVKLLSLDWWRYPIERNAFKRLPVITSNLNAVFALPDASHVWAVGNSGMIIHSNDGGRTWTQQPIVIASEKRQEHSSSEPAKASQLGIPDLIPRAYAGEEKPPVQQAPRYQEPPAKEQLTAPPPIQQQAPEPSKQPPEVNPPAVNEPAPSPPALPDSDPRTVNLRAIQFIDAREGWVVGDDGTILHTTDGGTTWTQQTSGASGMLTSVHFTSDGSKGWVVGDYGTIRHTPDGGTTWTLQTSETIAQLYSMHFTSDGRQGWVVGRDGTILHTTDGGSAWTPQTNGTIAWLLSVHFTPDGRQGWVVSDDPSILYTTDGGTTWTEQSINSTNELLSVHFTPSGRQGWVVGVGGTILYTTDSGTTWTPQSSGATVWLTSVHVLPDGRQGWVVGFDGVILHTVNGGTTWLPQSRSKGAKAEEASTYQIWFAPWYYLVGWLLPLALLFVASRQRQEESPPAEESVADRLLSDRPLEAGDPDPLGFSAIAQGLSRFLRNEKTQPPLTIAVTGEWGSGKSSLMNLLKADLERYGFRPVWFNAWHHQQEEQLLAALLASVRRQSVPPWWRLNGIMFRFRLLSLRSRQHLLLFLPLLLVLAFSLGYLLAHPQSPSEAFQQAQQWLNTAIAWLKTFAPGEQTAQPPTPDSGGSQQSLFAWLTSLAVSLIALRKGLTTFGVDPATLLASVSDNAQVRDLGAQVSFRQKFASEFRDVTKALHPRTMLVLIDDLDRCHPDKVLEVLEAINFLVSSGECYVVMGMALERIERCVGLGFKDVAEELIDQKESDQDDDSAMEEGKKKRAAFARQYLEKLINIEVPVPMLTNDQSAQLLGADAESPSEQNERHWKDLLTRNTLKRLAPWVLVSCALASSFWFGFRMENAPAPQQTAITATTSTPTSQPSPLLTEKPVQEPEQPKNKEPSTDGVFLPGQQSQLSLWLPLLPVGFLLAGWVWFSLQEQQDVVVKDSPEFVDALKIWLPLITAKQNTPRSVKRFLNRVRYLAMLQRPQEQKERTAITAQTNGKPAAIPEAILVALSAIQHCYREKLDEQTLLPSLNELAKDERIVRKENGYQNPMLLNESLEEHDKKFNTGLEFQSYWNKFVEMSKGIRVQL